MKHWLQKHAAILSAIPVLLTMGLIFWFSAQPGDSSGQLSSGLTAWLLNLVIPGFPQMDAAEQAAILSGVGFVIRKLAHFSEFALLGAALLFHLCQLSSRIPVKWLFAWAIGTLYAVSDEIHQIFVPGRGPAVKDVCIDAAGVGAGVAFLLLLVQIHTCKTKKRNL